MGLTSLLHKDPAAFAVLAVLLLYSIIAHEVAHGWAAKLFGDDTAERAGRLTPNPLPHIDPWGLVLLFIVGFGWARPVPVNYAVLRQRSRVAPTVVALAGVAANFLIACLAASALVFPNFIPADSVGAEVLATAVHINVMLAAFNLVPIPPLDGSRVVADWLPPVARAYYFRLERAGFLILVVLLYTGVLNPLIRFLQGGLYRIVGLVAGLAA